jgi:hypothetical protein
MTLTTHDKGLSMNPKLIAAAAVFIGAVVVANWLTSTYGLVGVGFGLTATAGTYAAGVCFGARDFVHEYGGIWWAVGCIVAGAVLSGFVASGQLAVASGVAFLLSEFADLAVYAPLRDRNRPGAVFASNIVGAAADTVLFLWLAGFPLTANVFAGQMVAKTYMTVLAVVLMAAVTNRRRVVVA